MIRSSVTFRASGPGFSPKAVEGLLRIPFTKQSERGSLGTIGRFRGQPIPYGSAELSAPANMDLVVPEVTFFEAVQKLVPACRSAGATSVLLHIDVAFVDQCNVEMSPEMLALLSNLGISVTITCFEDEHTA